MSEETRVEKKADLDLGDEHYLQWTNYHGERVGGNIIHKSDKTESGWCGGAFTITGSKWNVDYPEHAHWQLSGPEDKPTLSPSFQCHCGDHGFIREGKWVRA